MDIEQLVKDYVQDTLETSWEELVKKTVEDFLQNKFSKDDLFNGPAAETVRKYASAYCATEIGNRLRCGCWDGALFNKVFEENWPDQFKEQIKAEANYRARQVVKDAILEELEKIKKLVR